MGTGFKFTDGVAQRGAIYHAIGQLQDIHGYATVAEIAYFMNVSKTTARKYIKIFDESGDVCIGCTDYRPHVKKQIVCLSASNYRAYNKHSFRYSYELYISEKKAALRSQGKK